MGFLKDIFIKDWPRKLAAVLLACLIYAIVRVQLQDEQTFNEVRIVVVSEDSKTVVLNGKGLAASITISGTRRNLAKLKSNQQIEIVKKVEVGTRPGAFEFRLQAEDIKLPDGVVITGAEFIPSQVSVIIDQVVEREKNVRSRVDLNSVPDGWEITERKVTPWKVMVRGPKSIVDALDHVDTVEFQIPKKVGSDKIVQEVALKKPLGVDSVTPNAVEMTVEMNQHLNMISMKVPVSVLKKDNSKFRVANFVDKPEVTVWIKGEQEQIESLQPVHVKAFVELDESAEGEALLSIRVWLDRRNNRSSCHISDQKPKDINVIVEKIK